jgi:CubicO group peptidase (beta-lactamase class C family)
MREEFVQPELAELFDKPGTTVADYLKAARQSPSDWAPGSRWSYGNINYLMLTVIVERLTGRAIEEVAEERFFKPLGLQSIRLCSSNPQSVKGEARGHISREGKLVPHPPENVALFRGSGGFCGSAVDIARWMRALASGKVVSPRSYAEMTTRARLVDGREVEYGFAMDLGSHDGVQRNGHGGYGGGFSGQAAYYPDAELTVVVLTNRFVFPEQIERKIARRLLGRPEPAHRAVMLPADERQRYVGSYDVGIHGWFAHIKERDDQLWFELAAPPLKVPLIYLGDHEFVSADDPDGYRLTFSKDGQKLRLVGMGMMTWYGTRRP